MGKPLLLFSSGRVLLSFPEQDLQAFHHVGGPFSHVDFQTLGSVRATVVAHVGTDCEHLSGRRDHRSHAVGTVHAEENTETC